MYLQYADVQPARRQGSNPLQSDGFGPRPTDQPNSPQSNNNSSSNSTSVVSIVAVVVLIFFVSILIVSYTLLRRFRIQNREPKYIPTSYLKRKWHAWSPRGKYGQVFSDRQGRNQSLSQNTAYNPAGHEVGETAAAASAAAGVDRHASIRSVMTLPPYSYIPKETEQVIGREGERGGMDTVVEFPETQDEEETQREGQMESLYQIRLARRQEVAEREARRQERREARDRGDYRRLEQLRRESRLRAAGNNSTENISGSNTNLSAATLLAEHQSRSRERRVSEVTYASVGHVRHDGTRLRANSDDSERGGLLDSAAPMGERTGRDRGYSDAVSMVSTLSRPQTRDRSMSSAQSVSSDGIATPPRGSGESDHGANSGTSNSSPVAQRFTPDHSTGSDDIGDSRILESVRGSLPPDYEDLDWGNAPTYEEAVRRRESQRLAEQAHRNSVRSMTGSSRASEGLARVPRSQAPQLEQFHLAPLPSIQIQGASEPNTPVLQ